MVWAEGEMVEVEGWREAAAVVKREGEAGVVGWVGVVGIRRSD